MTTTSNIPGFRIDDNPHRPSHEPRVRFDRTALAVRIALREVNLGMGEEFEREFHTAMAEADDDFDLSRVEKVVQHWWMRALHYLDAEAWEYTCAVAARLAAGDESDLAKPVNP